MPHTQIKDKILKALSKTLSDELPVSGEQLARQLNVSRSDIHKHIKQLKSLGYGITARPHSGYLMTNLPSEITLKNLPIFLNKEYPQIHIKHYTSTDSTQLVAKKFALAMREKLFNSKDWYLFITDKQTGGYGRMRREWLSPPGGLWFSLLIPHPDFLPTNAPAFSLAFSLAVRSAIEKTTLLGNKFFLKWPNDIVFCQRKQKMKYQKVAGVILETSLETQDIEWLIVGCGINVNNKIPSEISETATSLFLHTRKKISIPHLLKEIVSESIKVYQIFCKEGFKGTLIKQYKKFDILRGNDVEVFSPTSGEVISGKAEYVDKDGCLVIRGYNSDNKSSYLKKVYAGDVTVKKFQ